MKQNKGETPKVKHEAIAELAWRIWQTEGGQHGRDQEYWMRAEQQLLAGKTPSVPVHTKLPTRARRNSAG